ncbi:MAG: nucleoside-diphosphate kinase [Candidatus Dormibacteraceae bacterium]
MTDALIIFKPDASHRLPIRAAMWKWLSSEQGWKLNSLSWYQPSSALIEQHYDFLQGRPFFPWLVDFMSALPLLVGRITAGAATREPIRYELGETRISESRPGSLRERYGIGSGVNVLHLSDSPESGAKELKLWASELDLDAVKAEVAIETGYPDHTFQLRSLANQYAAETHRELAGQEIKRLLAEESSLSDGDFESLSRIIIGAFV